MKKHIDDSLEYWEEYYRLHPVKIDPTLKDLNLENDPSFVKKLEDAKKLVEKIKFPPDWKTRK